MGDIFPYLSEVNAAIITTKKRCLVFTQARHIATWFQIGSPADFFYTL